MAPHDFNPSPAVADDLVSALAGDLTASLAGLAQQYDTSIEALTIWMTRPDIAERLSLLESAGARRTRLAATNYLPLAVAGMRAVLADFTDLHANTPYRPDNLRAIAVRARAAESARRAANILLRLANFTPGPRPQRAPRAAQPAGAISAAAHQALAPQALTADTLTTNALATEPPALLPAAPPPGPRAAELSPHTLRAPAAPGVAHRATTNPPTPTPAAANQRTPLSISARGPVTAHRDHHDQHDQHDHRDDRAAHSSRDDLRARIARSDHRDRTPPGPREPAHAAPS